MWSDVCQQCGMVLYSARCLRAAGVLYLVMGLLLSGAASYLMALIASLIHSTDDPDKAARLAKSTWVVALAFGALSFVLLLGVTGILMGVWQIRHGRRNPRLVRVAIFLYLIFMGGVVLVRVLS
jgi:MFS family permease